MSRTKAEDILVSLVIPAHNEAALLPRLLKTVERARALYIGGIAAVEVIVVDNASTDETATIARECGCKVVEVETRCIGAARNGGAAAASGSILAFVDADIRVHPQTFNAIDSAIASGRVVAGATGVSMERWSLGIAATYALMVPWVWILRMDTGVVFCVRDDFESVGGYDESLLFGEDVQLLVDLKRQGKPGGRRLTRLRAVKAIASTRKFDRWGDWHYFTVMPRVIWDVARSKNDRSELGWKYWYEDRSRD